MDGDTRGYQRGQLRPLRLVVGVCLESQKVLMEALEVIGEVHKYWEALYAKISVNPPALERLVRAHIPQGVPDEWRSVQDYTL